MRWPRAGSDGGSGGEVAVCTTYEHDEEEADPRRAG